MYPNSFKKERQLLISWSIVENMVRNSVKKVNMNDSSIPSSSGSIVHSDIPTTTMPDVTTVSLRPQHVQAIVTGLASNPDTLSAVALVIRAK